MTSDRNRERYRVDDLLIDIGAVAVRRGDEQLPVPDLSFATLAFLVRRAPDVVSHDDLVGEVWGGMAVSDETIKQRIALLRRALGDDWREPRYVRSVRGRGYQLVPVPERLEGVSAHPRREPRHGGYRVVVGVGITATVLAVATAAFIRSSRGPKRDASTPVEAGVSSSDLVARAREYFDLHRKGDNERAIQLFRQALERTPDDAHALAGLSLAYSQRAAKFNEPVTWADEAEGLARRAIELDPDLAEAHHALGLSLDSQGRLASALDSYRRAVELDPRHLRATGSGAYVLYVRGELAEALRWNLSMPAQGVDLHYLEIQIADTLAALDFAPTAEAWYQKAVTLRPDNLFAAITFAAYRLNRGNLTGAEELIRQAVEAGIERPELFELRGHLAVMQGETGKARKLYGAALEISPRSPASIRLLALSVARDPETFGSESRAVLEEMDESLRSGNEWPPSAIDLAILATATGDFDGSLAAIDRAIDLGYRDSAWLLVDPALAALREEAGFWPRIERVRALVATEREIVLAAGWLPDGFLDAAR